MRSSSRRQSPARSSMTRNMRGESTSVRFARIGAHVFRQHQASVVDKHSELATEMICVDADLHEAYGRLTSRISTWPLTTSAAAQWHRGDLTHEMEPRDFLASILNQHMARHI